MKCTDCGTQLVDQASFCWKCGKSQKATHVSNSTPASFQSETCEIDYEDTAGLLGWLVLTNGGRFVARAIGTKGAYSAGQTRFFWLAPPIPLVGYILGGGDLPSRDNKNHVAYYNVLVEHLVKDGWEPVLVSGVKWYQSSFRRIAR